MDLLWTSRDGKRPDTQKGLFQYMLGELGSRDVRPER